MLLDPAVIKANSAAGVSIVAATVSVIPEVREVVQLIAGVVAIASGLVAICYTIWKWGKESRK